MNETIEFIGKMLQTPPVEFAELYETGEVDSQEKIEQLERAANHLAMLAAYLEGRFVLNVSHNSAVKKANKTRRAVRKAQGYNITHDISF